MRSLRDQRSWDFEEGALSCVQVASGSKCDEDQKLTITFGSVVLLVASRVVCGMAGWGHVEPGREEKNLEIRWRDFHLSLDRPAPVCGRNGAGGPGRSLGEPPLPCFCASAGSGLFLVWGRWVGRGGRVQAARSRQGPGGTGQPPLPH